MTKSNSPLADYHETCAVEGCESQRTGRKKYCRKHQTRYERHGDPNIVHRSAIMVGEKFSRLTVKKIVGKDKSGNTLYLCSCECGGSTTTRSFSLRNGRTQSCGCFHKDVVSQKKERIIVSNKKCSSCGVVKDISEFGKRSTAVDGHKSLCNPCSRLWHKRNQNKVAETNRHRKRKKNNATPKWIDRNLLQEIEQQRIDLEKRTGARYEIDHIIPIKHPLICGLHVPWNLQIVTAEYNNSKGNRVSEEFLQTYGLSEQVSAIKNDKFVNSDPTLSALWDKERNHPIRPDAVHLSCPTVIWWKCPNNHSWSKSLILMQKNSDCPICSGREEVDFSNEFINPDIAAEWDYVKNAPWSPENFRRQSNKEVFWICDKDHSYSKSITARSRGVGCPICAKQGLRTYNYRTGPMSESAIRKRIDPTVFVFFHETGITFRGTRWNFKEKFNLRPEAITKMIQGKQRTHKGWTVIRENQNSE